MNFKQLLQSVLFTTLFFFLIPLSTYAQVTFEVTVLDGMADSDCGPGAAPHLFRVNVDGQGWTTYPESGNCFTDFPHVNYSTTYNCPADNPGFIEICFRTFTDVGLFCIEGEICEENYCETVAIPAPGNQEMVTLSIAQGGDSWGEASIQLSSTGSYNGTDNDFPCDAIDLGILDFNANLGDPNTSTYNNYCGTNLNEPNPFFDDAGWYNNVATWFTFSTGPIPGPIITLNGYSDPSGFGDPMDIQIAIYSSDDQSCTGNFTIITNTSDASDYDETTKLGCILEPNTTYFMLIDGSTLTDDGLNGWFGLQIIDHGIQYPPDFICDAYEMGAVPEGGSVTTGMTQTNICATATDDPFVSAFGTQFSSWYVFQAPSSGHVTVYAESDEDLPEGLDAIDIQLGIFQSSNDNCDGNFQEVFSSYDPSNFDESFELTCLEPGGTYYVVVDGATADIEGVYSVTVTDEGIFPAITQIDTMLCAGQSITVNGEEYTSTSVIDVLIPLPNGCDSIIVGNVEVVDAITTQLDTTLCIGSSIFVAGNEYSSAGPINETLTAVAGCDSIISGSLSFYAVIPETVLDETICAGSTLIVGDTEYSSAGTFSETLTASTGCDSIVSGTLEILDILFTSLDTAVCFGMEYSIGNSTYSSSGIYEDSLITPAGCLEIVTSNLTILDAISGTFTFQNSTGAGMADGTATITAMNGAGGFQYLWPSGETSNMDSNLEGGLSYCVSITDVQGCEGEACFEMPFSVPINATLVSTAVDCSDSSDGSILVSLESGSTPVNYSWENEDGTLNGNGTFVPGFMEETIDNLASGIYTFTFENSDETTTFTSEINAPSPLLVNLMDVQNISCFEECDGIIDVQAPGGTGDYEYSWSSALSGPSMITDLCADDYEVTVLDANGCLETLPITLTEPEAFIVSLLDQTPVSCNGDGDGTATLTTNGDPISFVWDNGEEGPTAYNLDAGTHLVSVTNIDLCQSVFIVTINEPAFDLNATIIDNQEISCAEANDGILEVFPEGGSLNYTYLWSNGATDQIIENLSVGEYFVSVTDEYNCTVVDSFYLLEPELMVADFEITDLSCEGNGVDGSIVVSNVSGGLSPFTYSLDGTNYSGNTDFNNLSAGVQTLSIQDANSCFTSYEIDILPAETVFLEISENASITLGESIQLSTFTLTDSLIYSWSPATELSCTDCPDPVASPSETTTYTLVATDINSLCEGSASITIYVQDFYDIFFPNMFSPNDDGFNDQFKIFAGSNVQRIADFKIFNRWGALVYEAQEFDPTDSSIFWDGTFQNKLVNDGVYIFYADVIFINGESKQFTGDITIVR